MTKRKEFNYGDHVRVKVPRKKAFVGTVYSQYRDGPRGERRICVNHPNGCGIAYLIRYVTLVEARHS